MSRSDAFHHWSFVVLGACAGVGTLLLFFLFSFGPSRSERQAFVVSGVTRGQESQWIQQLSKAEDKGDEAYLVQYEKHRSFWDALAEKNPSVSIAMAQRLSFAYEQRGSLADAKVFRMRLAKASASQSPRIAQYFIEQP